MAERLRLGDRVLDLQAQTLSDAAGRPVAMRPQAFAVLALLARHAGEVISKERLFSAVWPGLVVTDGSIAQAISDVRAALGEGGHELIRTIARRGYLLVGGEVDAPPPARATRLVLPPVTSALFGRAAELEELGTLLAAHRLVTVVGAGGIGKTVLALAAAHAAQRRGAGAAAVGWVDLAPIADAALLPGTIARALELPLNPHGDPLAGLLRALRPVEALVVLDNAEPLVDAVAAFVSAALAAAPGLRVLVTSQVALQLDAERLLRLAPLALPQPGEALDAAAGSPAVALFVDRAQALDHRFVLTPDNLGAVARVCCRLDGLPLAIRLAASRVHMLGLSSIEMHLDDRLGWLAQESREAPQRQRTLLAALQWSYGLLAAPEQRLFRLLGVFVGGFSPALVRELLRSSPELPDPAGLIERSLVVVEPGDPPRYRLLESQRAFALHELERLGELDDARAGHARAVAAVMEPAGEAIWSTPDDIWMARWGVELDNLRAAMKATERSDPVLCASMVASATALYRLRDLGSELWQQVEAIDPAALESTDPANAARFWVARSYLGANRSAGLAFDCAVQAERLARAAGSPRLLYMALCQQGTSTHVAPDAVPALLAEIAALESPAWPARLRTQRRMAAFALQVLLGQWDAALETAEAGLVLAAEAGATVPLSLFSNWILVALLHHGEAAQAEERGRVFDARLAGAPVSLLLPLTGTRSRVALACGDLTLARQRLGVMIEQSRQLEWLHFDVFADLYRALAFAEGRLDAAARLLGFAEVATQRAWRAHRPPPQREQARQRLVALLGAERLAGLCDEGRRLEREDAAALALAGPSA